MGETRTFLPLATQVRLWSVRGDCLATLGTQDAVCAIALAGRTLAVGGSGAVRVWDTWRLLEDEYDVTPLTQLDGQPSGFGSSLALKGGALTVGTKFGTIRMWEQPIVPYH